MPHIILNKNDDYVTALFGVHNSTGKSLKIRSASVFFKASKIKGLLQIVNRLSEYDFEEHQKVDNDIKWFVTPLDSQSEHSQVHNIKNSVLKIKGGYISWSLSYAGDTYNTENINLNMIMAALSKVEK